MVEGLNWWKDSTASRLLVDYDKAHVNITQASLVTCSCDSLEDFVHWTVPALAARYSPRELRINIVCYATVDASALAPLKRLPHISNIHRVYDATEVSEAVRGLVHTAAHRVHKFTQAEVDDFQAYRRKKHMQRILTIMLGCPGYIVDARDQAICQRAGVHLLVASANMPVHMTAAAGIAYRIDPDCVMIRPRKGTAKRYQCCMPTADDVAVAWKELEYISAEHGYTPPKRNSHMVKVTADFIRP